MEDNLNNEGQPVEEQSTTEQPQSDQESQGFDFSSLNEYFKDTVGENPLSEESFKGLLDSQTKLSEFEQQIQSKDQELQGAMEYKTKYESFLETFDSEKLTPNKEALAISQLSDKHKGADIGVLSTVRGTDISSIDPLDGLVLANKLKVPGNYSDSDRKSVILQSLGIESGDEGEATSRLRIQTAYANEVGSLQEIKEFQPEGINFDIEAESKSYQENLALNNQKLTAHNKEALNVLLDGFKETKSTIKDIEGNDITLSYSVDANFKNNFLEPALKNLEKSGLKITQENASEIMSQVENDYFMEHRADILQHYAKQILSGQKEKMHQENHNDSPTNKIEAPPAQPREFLPVMEQIRQNIKK